jgi:hypothetical protein
MSTTPLLPAILTTGEAAARGSVSITCVHDWIELEPSLVAYETPVGKLLFQDRFDAFVANRGRQRPPKSTPRSRAVGSGGSHADQQ